MDGEKTTTYYTASSKNRNSLFPTHSSTSSYVSDIPVCDLKSHISLDGIDLKQMTHTQEQQFSNISQKNISSPKCSKKLAEKAETEFKKPQQRKKFILAKESLEIQTPYQSYRAIRHKH